MGGFGCRDGFGNRRLRRRGMGEDPRGRGIAVESTRDRSPPPSLRIRGDAALQRSVQFRRLPCHRRSHLALVISSRGSPLLVPCCARNPPALLALPFLPHPNRCYLRMPQLAVWVLQFTLELGGKQFRTLRLGSGLGPIDFTPLLFTNFVEFCNCLSWWVLELTAEGVWNLSLGFGFMLGVSSWFGADL